MKQVDITLIGMHAPSGQCDALVLYHHFDGGKAVFGVYPRKDNIPGYVIVASKIKLLVCIYTHIPPLSFWR